MVGHLRRPLRIDGYCTENNCERGEEQRMMQLQNDFQLPGDIACTYSKLWPDILATLSCKRGRVLSQVLAGRMLTGRTPTRIDAEALADL